MPELRKDAESLRRTIQDLIESGSAYHLDGLDRIYHRELKVVMIEEDGSVNVTRKADNMNFFRAKRDSGAAPLSRWAAFNYVEAEGETGQVVVTRKMQLRDKPEKFILGIQLVWEESRWQVIHETVFVQPLE